LIGILSDSHDNLPKIEWAVRVFNEAGCDLVIHAGDFVAPFAAQVLAGLRAPVKAVYGNCDGEKAGLAAALAPFGEVRVAPFRFQHGGLRFLLVHSNAGLDDLIAAAAPDVVVFGHTHKFEVVRKGKTLLVNPGEAGGWVHGNSTAALLDPASLTVDIVPL
jgi:putative phosphoesterase